MTAARQRWVERCIAPLDLRADGFGWRVASSAFVERWKREEALLTARGYRAVHNRLGDMLVSYSPEAKQAQLPPSAPPVTAPLIEIVDPVAGEITVTLRFKRPRGLRGQRWGRQARCAAARSPYTKDKSTGESAAKGDAAIIGKVVPCATASSAARQ